MLMLAAVSARAQLPAPVPEAGVRNVMERIRTVIPKGWAVSYEAEYNYLKIALGKQVEVETSVMNAPAGGPAPQLKELRFSFRVMPKVPVATFQRLAAENAQTKAKMAVIHGELAAYHIENKSDFAPQTAEQREKVDAYHKLEVSLHKLPDFYFKDEVSLSWMENGPETVSPPPTRATDDTIRAEFQKVRADVAKVLTAYPPGK